MDRRTLSNTFAIDVCAYSLMDNHMHSVLKVNAPLAHSWSDEEVIRRWQLIFAIPVLVARYFNGECHSDAEQDKALETSKHTSIKQRIDQIKAKPCTTAPIKLAQFISDSQTEDGNDYPNIFLSSNTNKTFSGSS